MTDRRPLHFIAVDGEGITDPETNRQAYVLLANSEGESVQRNNKDGLGTLECFDFLLNMRAEHPGSVFCGFGFNYDVNMMLRDIPKEQLAELWEQTEVKVVHGERRFRLEWLPSKFFAVTEGGMQVKVYDTWGFFQSSFLHAIEDWDIGTKRERELIEQRKEERSDFSAENFKEIKRYCLLECRFLVELLEELAKTLRGARYKEIDLVPATWLGPGAIANKLLRYTVKPYHAHDTNWPKGVRDAIMRAYFGGRVECFMQGELRDVTSYDIRSAYPRAMLELPALAGGHWRKAKDFPEPAKLGLYFARWNLPSGKVVAPFPVRNNRTIYYPLQGAGWYHAPEIRVALRLFGDYIEILDGYVFEPTTKEQPFDFVPELFRQRKAMKAAGNPSEFAYKLALNSLYGKLAQGLGYKGTLPAFQSYAWAGMITSHCRARVLDMIGEAQTRAIFSATDAVAFLGDPGFEESSELGGFERSQWSEFFLAQAGVYVAFASDGSMMEKSRGFFVRDLDFDAIRRVWREEGVWGTVDHTSHRFYGIGSTLGRTDFSIWRTWQDEPRRLGLFSDRKWYARNVTDDYKPELVERLVPPSDAGVKVSEPYVPKQGSIDVREDWDWLAGIEQPRIME